MLLKRKIWSRKELPPGWIKDGYISEPKGVGAIIISLLESVKTSKNEFFICISGLPFTYRIAKFPHIKQSVLKDSVQHFMRKEIAMPIEQMCLSWSVMAESADEVELLILGIDQKIVDSITETMREAKIKYWNLDLKSLALARAASMDSVIVISVESDCYDIVIVDKGSISTMHTVTVEEDSRDDEERSKQILIETSKAITYDTKKRGNPPEKKIPLLLTGELSQDKDLRDLIQTELGHTVGLLTTSLKLQADFPIHLYSTNIGLALRSSVLKNFELPLAYTSTYNDVDLDIVSGSYASKPKRVSSTYLLVPILISIVFGIVLPIYGARVEHRIENLRLQNELAIVDLQIYQQTQQEKLNEDKLRETENRITEVNGQVDSLRKVYKQMFGAQGNIAANLRKVVNALPGQSYFSNITHSPGEITIKGSSEDAFQALDYIKNLEQEGYYPGTRIQYIGDASSDNITDNINDDEVTFEIIIDSDSG